MQSAKDFANYFITLINDDGEVDYSGETKRVLNGFHQSHGQFSVFNVRPIWNDESMF